ncbi:MAG: cytochrome c biogenesis protein ResB [Cyanobium sp.]
MSVSATPLLRPLQRLLAWIADLRTAIALLLLIAIASGIGTAIPQGESEAFYQQRYDPAPWLGLLKGHGVLALQLDHVYGSSWFLALLAWLGLALLLCSWRRQWPALQAALRWVDYREARQLSKLSLAETVPCADSSAALARLEQRLRQRGWQVQAQANRLAARRGVAGKVGPLLVHAGLVLLMVGAAWGAVAGQRQEQFLAPGRELELLDSRGRSQLTVALDGFTIQRDPAGRPEQFTSSLRILPAAPAADGAPPPAEPAQISVNHPLRTRGITLYQADWALVAIELQIGRSPVLQLPLQPLPQLGEQVWGLVLPTRPDGSEPVLLSVSNEAGPVEVYGPDGSNLGSLAPGGEPLEVRGLPLRVGSILPASGILLKRDPGVPLVYAGFAVTLLGGGLSLIATRQLWAVSEAGRLHVGGLCNRSLTGFATVLPQLLADLEASTPEPVAPQQG